MNKAELITSMAEKSQLTKKDAESALKAFIDSVQEALESGEKVQLIGEKVETQELRKLSLFLHQQFQYSKQVKNLKIE